ncbi:GNAT family N-acetyltransferase [Flagellimonas pacifica]|uniref:Ribosomal protein S18 acetylase RimI n=1 Tax=Flagellimonas pacifica TaxID=1247520 RepID=A0A285MH28_9FLAO|nr:GNAT family N-acetyltransferase [Allomuricauda parva]SNY94781.1 Ribosomal protein S18 acetylase RimI [Allomuricauda parva]
MKVKNLEHIDFSMLMDCFLKAFENYFVKMPTDHEYYKDRWRMANVRFDLSYGMFDGDKLVGFIINAIDERAENLIAFNTGTGVLPEYRGQRIVNSICQYAFPELQKNGITTCRLEVIKDNVRAIKAYNSIGFKITKSYKCFSGDIEFNDEASDFELKKVDEAYFDWSSLHQHIYSWDNHINTIKRGSYSYYAILVEGKLDSYFVMQPDNDYVAQLDVIDSTIHSWNRLFTAMKSILKTIKINNVDERLNQKIDFLKKVGLKNTVDQYEMELNL